MTDLMQVLKKNAGWHAFTMLITGSSAFLGIVFTKHLLSPNDFIFFNSKINAVLMVNTFSISWLTISTFRMLHSKPQFFGAQNLILLAIISASVVGIPFFVLWYFLWKSGGSLVLPILLQGLVIVYAVLLVKEQASLNAKRASAGESIRSGIQTFLLALPYSLNLHVSENYCWCVWLLAYGCSLLFFIRHSDDVFNFSKYRKFIFSEKDYFKQVKEVFLFGYPYCIWILFSYLMINSDRWYLLWINHDVGDTSDYLAIADTMMRGAGFLFMPLNTSAFPLIASLYDAKDYKGITSVIRRIVRLQSMLVLASVVGLLLLHGLFFTVLNISITYQPLQLSVLLLSVHSIWLLGYVLQKPAEMGGKTPLLSLMLFICTLVVYLCLWVFIKPLRLQHIVACLAFGVFLYLSMVVCYVKFYFKSKG